MILYLSIIFFAMTLISALNMFFGSEPDMWIIGAVFMSVLLEVGISGLGSLICLKAPDSWFAPNKRLFVVTKKEQRFYEKIGIKNWKDKVWELGGLGGFRKNKIKESSNSKYLYRFIIESNKGMVGHILNICTGFLVVFALPAKYFWRIGIPVALVGALLNLLPILVLRYNLPKLTIAYRRAYRLESRAGFEEDEAEDEEGIQNA